MNIDIYLETIKSIQNSVIVFLDREDNLEENYNNILEIFFVNKIRENKHEIKLIFNLLLNISNNHHRYSNFFEKIEKIILYFSDEIKNFFTNSEIFDIFQSNKRILLFLIKENLLLVDEYFVNKMTNSDARAYFTPEILDYQKKSGSKGKMESDVNNKSNYENIFLDESDSTKFDFFSCSDEENNNVSKNVFSYMISRSDEYDMTESNDDDESIIKNNQNELTIENNQNKSTIENNQNKSTIENNQNKSTIENNQKESTIENIENNQNDTNIIYVDDEKRMIGENDNYFAEIIRKDMIEEFIVYINKKEVSLHSIVEKSIFETNPLLIGQEVTLIEYASFFGSVQIFKYLYQNGVELTPSLWIYSIHGDNAELIRILEDHKIKPEDKTFESCYEESIACHHNDIINYIESNYISSKDRLDYYSYWYEYYNFQLIPTNLNEDSFYDLIEFDYYTLIKLLLNNKNIDINKKIDIIDESYHFYGPNLCYKEKFSESPLAIAISKGNLDIIKLFLEIPDIDINSMTIIEKTYYRYIKYYDEYRFRHTEIISKPLLQLAFESGNKEIIQILMCNPDIDVNSKCIKNSNKNCINEKSLLYIAIEKENIEYIKLLLSNPKIDTNIVNKELDKKDEYNEIMIEKTSLIAAIEKQNIEIVKLLLTNPDIDVNYIIIKTGYLLKIAKPTLYCALSTKNNEIIKLLLSRSNVDVNARKIKQKINNNVIEKEMSLLYKAVVTENIEAVKLLLSHQNIDVNFLNFTFSSQPYFLNLSSTSQYDFHFTALIAAIKRKYYTIIKLLLSHPNINANIKSIKTKIFVPSQFAYLHPTIDVTKPKYKNITKVKRKTEKTPLYMAVQMRNIKIVKLLLSNPSIDVNIKSVKTQFDEEEVISEKTPLYLAVDLNNEKIVNLLLSDPNIDVNIKCLDTHWKGTRQSLKSPLYLAIKKQYLNCVKLLLSNQNIDVNSKVLHKTRKYFKESKSLLHQAVRRNNIQIVELLLKFKNIDVNAKDKNKKKPIDIAYDERMISLINEYTSSLGS